MSRPDVTTTGTVGVMAKKVRVRRSQKQKISDKISLLVREGKPRKQAIAIAHSMSRRGEL